MAAGGFSLTSIFYMVALVDMTASAMVVTVLANYLKETLGLSSTSAGMVMSIYGVIQFLSGPLFGSLGDQKGHGRMLAWSMVLCAPAYAMMGLQHSLLVIVVSRVAAGVVKHTQTMLKTVIGVCMSPSEKLNAFGKVNSMANVGFIVGPFLSGHLSEEFGYEIVFILSGFLFFCNSIIVWRYFPSVTTIAGLKSNRASSSDIKQKNESKSESMSQCNGRTDKLHDKTNNIPDSKPPTLPNLPVSSKAPNGLLAEIRAINWGAQWDLLLVRFLFSFAVLIFRSNTSWVLREKFGLDKRQLGYVTSYQGMVAFLSSYFTKFLADQFQDTVRCYTAFSVLMTGSIVGLCLGQSLISFCVFIGLLCVCTSVLRAVSYDIAVDRGDLAEMGLLMGVSGSLVSSARAFSPALGGWLHDIAISLPALVAIASCLIAIAVTVGCTTGLQKQHVAFGKRKKE